MYLTVLVLIAFITAVYSAKTLIFSLVEREKQTQTLSAIVLIYSLIIISLSFAFLPVVVPVCKKVYCH